MGKKHCSERGEVVSSRPAVMAAMGGILTNKYAEGPARLRWIFVPRFLCVSSRTFVGGFVQNPMKNRRKSVICVHLDTCADTGISGKIFLMKKNPL